MTRNRCLLPALALLLSSCAVQPPAIQPSPVAPTPCPVCPAVEAPKPVAKPLQAADWADLPGWGSEEPGPALDALLNSCKALQKRPDWREACTTARDLPRDDANALRSWFEAGFQPWRLVNPDGSREGLITGYYEPLLSGSRTRKPPYLHPVQGVPDDLIDVELGELYPELKHMRLRGRLDGRRLWPYFSRAEWDQAQREDKALLWVDDELDLFFMQIQGSGQVKLDDGSRVRVGYADQNGHPYHSIGRWLIDRGELVADKASMQGIRAWARAHPERVKELLAANPSMVFFRELPLRDEGPPGALGVALTPERSIAVDPRSVPLGAPVWLATTYPNSERALTRLMLAQDTGGAIRGVVRADFYWGSGAEAGAQAGKMRQKGQMWVLLPKNFKPN